MITIFREDATSALAVFLFGSSPLVELEFGDVGFSLRMRTRIKDLGASENQQQTQPSYSTAAGWILTGHINGSERSRHCAIPTSQDLIHPTCHSRETTEWAL